MTNTLTQEQQENGIVNALLNLGGRLVGFIGAIFGLVSFSASAIFGWLTSRWTEIWNFDWNATDAQLQAAMENQNVAIASAWGGALGGSFGWITAIGIGYGISYVCPVIGGAALANAVASGVLPEALEEVGGLFQNALRVTANSFISRATMSLYINYRRILKNAPLSLLEAVYGSETAQFIKNFWGNEGQPNISFASQLDSRLDSLNPSSQAFWEEFFDEAWDSFTEAGYLIASELDAAIAQSKVGASLVAGKQRAVTVQPDRRVDGEAVAFVGREEQVKQDVQLYLNQHRLIYNRDVGQIVGQPALDWYKAMPQRRKLTIVFKSVERPPFYDRDNGIKTATYSVPEPKVNLSWEKIKRAAKPYNWGRFRCTANLTNGRQMAVYGASPQEAEDKLRELLDLSECEFSTLSITEEKDRNPRLRKEMTRLYPATGTMLVRRPSLNTIGLTDLDGNTWDEEHIRFDLWCDEEPEEFQFVRFGVGDDANLQPATR